MLVLGVVFMGVGWWRPAGAPEVALPDSPRLVRRAAVVSALGGAFGLWVGAASVIPTIAFIGLAAALVTLVAGRRAAAEGFQFDPDAWRLSTMLLVGRALSAEPGLASQLYNPAYAHKFRKAAPASSTR